MKFHFPPRILVINSKNTSGEILKKRKLHKHTLRGLTYIELI